MSGNLAGGGPQTNEWQVRLVLTEAGDLTTARAVLDTGAEVLEADAEARRSPHDPVDHGIGDELAVGRALLDLGHRLVHAGSVAAEASESARRRDTE